MPTHPLLRPGLPTLHHSQLTDLSPDDPLFREWRVYRRELPRLLLEGFGGKYGLFKGEELVGIFDSEDAARGAGSKLVSEPPFMVHPLLEYEPVVRFPVYHYIYPLVITG